MNAWESLTEDEYEAVWDRFYAQFNFNPSINYEEWPSIKEPNPSITYQFADYPSDDVIADINTKALSVFQSVVSTRDRIYVLDWQHECYWFNPFIPFDRWEVPVFPDGDYSIFLAKDFSFGIFGHPWNKRFVVGAKDYWQCLQI